MSKKSAFAPVGRGPIHDSSYKLLYSHVAMVSDLLQGFIPGAWVDELDLATLEKCNGSYISDDLRDRTDDLIWRVRWSHDWFYVYLLLEFQSKIDCWMAVWIQTYLALLAAQLPAATCCPIASKAGPSNGNRRVWSRAAKRRATYSPAWLATDSVPESRHRPSRS